MIKIGDFAKLFNVSIKTIRFYEEKKLLKPAYVDVFTGYRYYDENNIDEMSKIITYKNLGFELKEIRNIEDETILNKIEEYKNKIKSMYSQIDTLDSLLKSKEGKNIGMKTFVNDENAIGKWKLVGISQTKNDYFDGKLLDEDISIKELYLMDNGEEYWVISWSKGSVYINNEQYKYEIEGNKLYLYLTGLYSDETKIAIYERVDNKHYKKEDIMHLDNTDVPFVEDENIIGIWECVGIVDNDNSFDLNSIDTENLVLKYLSVFPKGEAYIKYSSERSKNISYTKGYIKNICFDNTMSAYSIKDIDSEKYLIVEWKSGDYIYGGYVSCCYVFKKIK